MCACLQAQQKAGIFLRRDARSTWRTGFVLAQGQGSPCCPSIPPVWNLFYPDKYLELKAESGVWVRLIGAGESPAPYI